MADPDTAAGIVERYLLVGLRLGTLHAEIVDAYYGPSDLRARVAGEPPTTPAAVGAQVSRLIADLDAGMGPELSDQRRRWLRAQLVGLSTVAAKLDGADIGYADEVEACYGVRPQLVPTDRIEQAHRALDSVLDGSGSLGERLAAFREAHVIPPERLQGILADLADEFRSRTREMFGLPDGEQIRFELVTDQPWSGFNYYEGGLSSRVAINCDLPVLSTSIGHLVAHEAYPGHHTEHCLKEVGLVRSAGHLEESIFLVGAPQCLVAEGLADLGIEVLLGDDRLRVVGEIVRSHGVRHDDETVAAVADFGEVSSQVRGNLGLLLHEEHVAPEDVVDYAERWLVVDRPRAEKAVAFQTDPTWRAYISCYVEGLPLCRRFVDGDPSRFRRLLTEPLIPADLAAA
jgi:hypothetical protein